jgi:hypothetical protein
MDNSLQELFTKYVDAHIKYNECKKEENELYSKYYDIRKRCDAKPYLYKDNTDTKVKCYNDMFHACVAYNAKSDESSKLYGAKYNYENELKKLNYPNLKI